MSAEDADACCALEGYVWGCLFFEVTQTRAITFFFGHSCTIDWVKGKNVTLKTIKKKQKHKGRGTVRVVTKTVPNDSFFNFFTPPEGKNTDVS